MKRKIVLSFVMAVALALATSGMAMADVIAQWNYNNQTTGIAASTPYTTGQGDENPNANVGTGTQAKSGTFTAWGYNSGLQPSSGAGDFAIDSATGLADIRYRLEGVNTGEGLIWTVSTAGYENIQVELSLFTTTTGINSTFSFDYWNGTSWIEATTASYAGNAQATYYISPGADANNNSAFKFRFLIDNSSTARTLTYDWVQVTGTQVVPIPAAAWLLGSGLLGLVAIRRRMKK
jgi:hypothetical protein